MDSAKTGCVYKLRNTWQNTKQFFLKTENCGIIVGYQFRCLSSSSLFGLILLLGLLLAVLFFQNIKVIISMTELK